MNMRQYYLPLKLGYVDPVKGIAALKEKLKQKCRNNFMLLQRVINSINSSLEFNIEDLCTIRCTQAFL